MHSATIMIIEDEFIIAKDMAESLTAEGYRAVYGYSTGEQALEGLVDVSPDLLVVDIVLGGEMNGIETAKAIRARIGAPVVFLTGVMDQELVEQAKEAGPVAVLSKPVRHCDLLAAVRNGLGRVAG